MRTLFPVVLIALSLGCATTKNGASKRYPLNGDWVPVKQEMGGKALPAFAIAHQQLTMKDTTYTLTAESVDKGSVHYKDGKMDIYGRDGVNAGKHFMAIYKMENEQLIICYNLFGDHYPESYVTERHPMYFLSTFNRASK
jgi:uncharacterized protein (TIGR03067 family)